MLTHIHIRDFTIIDQLDLDLENGMTVLTGETGAGKSIIIDALNLVLGDRADSGVVRHGCARTDISATFNINNIAAAQHWLIEHDLAAALDIECVLRRTVTTEGRSKGYINGSTMPLQSMQELGEMLVDIHGQHEHQSLLKNDMQRQLLDDYAGAGHNSMAAPAHATARMAEGTTPWMEEVERRLEQPSRAMRRAGCPSAASAWMHVSGQEQLPRCAGAAHADLLAKLSATYHQWKTLDSDLDMLRGTAQDRDARLDMLRYQVRELETLALGENEVHTLEEERVRLASSGRLLSTCQTALHNLYEGDEGDLYTVLGRTLSDLEQLRALDSRLATICELLNNAHLQIEEGANELRHYRETLDLDPERLQWVEQRLDAIHQLARKHRTVPAELPALLTKLSAELSGIEHSDARQEQLQNELNALSRAYREQAGALSTSRACAAQEFGKKVTEAMQPLGLSGARFEVALQPLDDTRFSATGMERVEFLVSTNPGHPLKPLSKVASGGELSRISLAIQVIAARSSYISTLIFDEVDTGIGGGVAETVGRQLRALGESHQVMCVTHLPQVAALGHHHLHVRKETSQGVTTTRIQPLTGKPRNEEIARMLGGVEITDQTRAHAKEMIERAKK